MTADTMSSATRNGGATCCAADSSTANGTSTAAVATSVKFHLALSVSNLATSITFYRILFGQEPAKQFADYAKFEVDEPPLILSLIPSTPAGGGALNHLGLRLSDSRALVDLQYRLEAAGIRTMREENVACCHSRQTKFWVTDPDRTLWELYVLHEGSDEPAAEPSVVVATHSCAAGSTTIPATLVDLQPYLQSPSGAETAVAVVWQHVLIQPIPQRIDHADGTVDEVRLEGTFNLALEPGVLAALLAEIHRVLRPAGRLQVHGLVSDRSLVGRPDLPGPAALVEYVPVESEPAAALTSAGFVEVGESQPPKPPSFFVGDAQLRELLLTAQKPPNRS